MLIEKINSFNPTDFRLLLQDELIKRTNTNPAYSLRAFARALEVDFSTLAKIIKGHRKIGKKTILKLGTKLGLNPKEVQHFIDQANSYKKGPSDSSLKEDQVLNNYQQLTLDSFQIISDWYHYAILELMRVDGFKTDQKWIAKVLGLTASQVNVAIERLQRIGILEITPKGQWMDRSGGKCTTLGNEFTAGAFKNLQKHVLEKALTALEHVSLEKRDQTSMTFAIDTEKMKEAKKMITRFRRELSAFLSRGKKRNEVYNLSISLYPLSHIKKGE